VPGSPGARGSLMASARPARRRDAKGLASPGRASPSANGPHPWPEGAAGGSSVITSAGLGVRLARRLDGRLVGRARDRRQLDGLVESAEGDGAAVVVGGEVGVGKTVLVTYVADVASNRVLRVLRARREESEAVLAIATLADKLRPSLNCRRPVVKPSRCAWLLPADSRLARWRRTWGFSQAPRPSSRCRFWLTTFNASILSRGRSCCSPRGAWRPSAS
jgi:AAA ATPase domain